MSKKRTILLNIILPFLIGGMIYLLFRPNDLLLFKWVELLGLTEIVEPLREITYPFKSYFPEWIIYSLPNGLWLYSLIISILTIWNHKITQNNIGWLLLAFLLGIGGEFGQLLGLIQGTFDIIDSITILLFGIIALGQNISFSIYKPKLSIK